MYSLQFLCPNTEAPMRPAEQLLGLHLNDGWIVDSLVSRSPTATGGTFSVGYVVRNSSGQKAFLKALDYSEAFRSPNPPEFLQWMTSAYLFEKNICEQCRDFNLGRVARAIGSGNVLPDPSHAANRVDYLIFELAAGDIRSQLDAQHELDVVFVLRTLHHVATGIGQMHTADMAHQDLKPSNVLVFPDGQGSKVGDLGRAWSKTLPAPHDASDVAGDRGYAPPEALYGSVSPDTHVRRFGCDVYHLGSLATFLFTRVHMGALLLKALAPEHRPIAWTGTYAEVLPYVHAAFELTLQTIAASVPVSVRTKLIEMIAELCQPDPELRGHPSNRGLGRRQFDLERYISRFDYLAHFYRCELAKPSPISG
jgi:serine/threonine protein kinase